MQFCIKIKFIILIFLVLLYSNILYIIYYSCFINPLASPSAGAPALKYGDVNTETTSLGEVKGLINIVYFKNYNN